MPGKIYLRLLILCGIWPAGIFGTFADEEIKQSSDFLLRQKRVVSYLSDEDIPVRINGAPYVVFIKVHWRIHCVGNILSSYVVITAASCVSENLEYYKVISSSVRTDAGNIHNITEARRRIGDPHLRIFDGVDLLVVNPPFVYTQYCQPIRLHVGPLLIGSFGQIRGWGYNAYNRSKNRGIERGTNIPKRLRLIEVPIISNQNCTNRYQPHLEITDKNVCTYHPQRHSGHSDIGAGLVVDGNLAGIFLWSGLMGQIDPRYPDVFAYLQDTYYNQWIRTNLQDVDSYFQNRHRV